MLSIYLTENSTEYEVWSENAYEYIGQIKDNKRIVDIGYCGTFAVWCVGPTILWELRKSYFWIVFCLRTDFQVYLCM